MTYQVGMKKTFSQVYWMSFSKWFDHRLVNFKMFIAKPRIKVSLFVFHAVWRKLLRINHFKLLRLLPIPLLNHYVDLVRICYEWICFFLHWFDLARAIDEFAVEKLRQIEAKYPLINTPADKVMNSLNEKTEPVRHVINTVKDTTTSTIQHGKEKVEIISLLPLSSLIP